MRKWMILLLIAVLAAGCSNDKKDVDQQGSDPVGIPDTEQSGDQNDSGAGSAGNQKEESQTNNGDSAKEDDSSDKENNTDSDKKDTDKEDSQKGDTEKEDPSSNSSESQNEASGLVLYRPDTGTKKTFKVNGNYEVTYDVTAENEKFVQRIIHLGASSTLQIIRWGEDKASIVYEIQNPEDTSNQLDDFEAYKPPELLISLSQTGSGESPEWEIVAKGKTIKVPYGEFDKVYVVQQTNTSSNGKKTVRKDYYAPGMGLIKETTDVDGEQSYHAELVLTKVSK